MEFNDLRRGLRCRFRWEDGIEEVIIIDYDHPKNRIEFLSARLIDQPESNFRPNTDGSILTVHHEKFDDRFSLILKN